MVVPDIDNLAKIIWDYHHMNHTLERADCILVLGSMDTRVAEWAARLFLGGWAPLMIFSGYLGNFTKSLWTQSEAEKFADIAMKMGVPKDKILIENRSTNTGENILFTRQLVENKGLKLQKFIVVQKPYMERRAYATFKKIWSEKDVIVSSPPISYEDYPTEEMPKDYVINIMTGDFQRIMEYPSKGFQIPQEIPGHVLEAYNKLVELGYTKHLIKK
jgi:uncharacterized SAM-binding protein YcdF (DUF218 family)